MRSNHQFGPSGDCMRNPWALSSPSFSLFHPDLNWSETNETQPFGDCMGNPHAIFYFIFSLPPGPNWREVNGTEPSVPLMIFYAVCGRWFSKLWKSVGPNHLGEIIEIKSLIWFHLINEKKKNQYCLRQINFLVSKNKKKNWHCIFLMVSKNIDHTK